MTAKPHVNSNWIVVTGAPSSGKTSVIHELAQRGYATQEEVARAYIEEQLAQGLTLDTIRGQDGVRTMQEAIFARMLALQAAADPAQVLFLDRGLPDSIAYFRLAGMDTSPVIAAAQTLRYRAVCLLERLPVASDDVRTEDDAAAQQLGEMFAQDYQAVGYDVIRVPVMDVTARADFILSHSGLRPLVSGARKA